jgi:hypothetical protein
MGREYELMDEPYSFQRIWQTFQDRQKLPLWQQQSEVKETFGKSN